HIQESDVAHINKIKKQQGKSLVTPLYTMEDTLKVFPLFKKLDMNEWYQLDDQVQLQYTEAGHIIGSACVNLKLTENQKTTRLTFSGDIGRYGDDILKSPESFPQADAII